MADVDLRKWLEDVEKHGELKRITGAGWDLEMSSISELVTKGSADPKPVLLFDEVPGYPKGFRCLFLPLSSAWRMAMTLGLPEDQLNPVGLTQNWREKHKKCGLIPPKVVKSGPVMDNTDEGDKIDVLKFPVPRFHELDTRRYIGTQHAVITKDPDTGFVNLGTYRDMVLDRNHLCVHWVLGRHGQITMEQKYHSKGKPMPIVVTTGMHPLLYFLAANVATPYQVSELDAAGGIRGEPLEVVEGPHTGIPIPAHAEIAIEGECYPGDLAEEGPFGEWHGYYSNRGLATVPEQVIRVKAVHYRNNPILACAHPMVPPHDFSLLKSLSSAEGIWDRLEGFGIAGIKGAWSHEVGSGLLFNVISIQQLYPGHSIQVGLIASQYPHTMGSYTVVVEEDIDPSDIQQVMWAMITRALPDRSIHILPRNRTSNVHTAISPADKFKAEHPMGFTASRVVIDACRDMEWKNGWYPIARMSPELRAKTAAKWKTVLSGLL